VTRVIPGVFAMLCELDGETVIRRAMFSRHIPFDDEAGCKPSVSACAIATGFRRS
jgi:hypothetical protein